MKRRMAGLIAAVGLSLSLTACGERGVEAPDEDGVCWHMARIANQPPRFNRLSTGVTSLEQCAANLEAMRLRFRAMGSMQEEVVGAYQGRFLFLRHAGVYTAQDLDGQAYLALVRTGDGRLATVGAVRPPPVPPTPQ